MTVIKGPEAVEQAIANTLITNLGAEITAITAAWGDNVPLPIPAPQNIYAGRRDLVPVAEGPCIVVQSLDGTQKTNMAADIANPLAGWGEFEHRLEVTILCQSDDLHTLDVQTKRYLVAIWEVLEKNQTLDGSLSGLAGIDPQKYGRSEVYKEGMQLMQFGGWEVVVHILENT